MLTKKLGTFFALLFLMTYTEWVVADPGQVIFDSIPRTDDKVAEKKALWDANNLFLWGANSGNYNKKAGKLLSGVGMASVDGGPTLGIANEKYIGILTMIGEGVDEAKGINNSQFADINSKLKGGNNVYVPILHNKWSLGVGEGLKVVTTDADKKKWLELQLSILKHIDDLIVSSGKEIKLPEGGFTFPDLWKGAFPEFSPLSQVTTRGDIPLLIAKIKEKIAFLAGDPVGASIPVTPASPAPALPPLVNTTVSSYQDLVGKITAADGSKNKELSKYAWDNKLPGATNPDDPTNSAKNIVNNINVMRNFLKTGMAWGVFGNKGTDVITSKATPDEKKTIKAKAISAQLIKDYKKFYLKETVTNLAEAKKRLTNYTDYYMNCPKILSESEKKAQTDHKKFYNDVNKDKLGDMKNESNFVDVLKMIPIDEEFNSCLSETVGDKKSELLGLKAGGCGVPCAEDLKTKLQGIDSSDTDTNLTLHLPEIRKLKNDDEFKNTFKTFNTDFLKKFDIESSAPSGNYSFGASDKTKLEAFLSDEKGKIIFDRFLKSLKIFDPINFEKLNTFLKANMTDNGMTICRLNYINNINIVSSDDDAIDKKSENYFNHVLSSYLGGRNDDDVKKNTTLTFQLYKDERRAIRTAFRLASSGAGGSSTLSEQKSYKIFKQLLLDHKPPLRGQAIFYALEASKSVEGFEGDASEEDDKSKTVISPPTPLIIAPAPAPVPAIVKP